MSELQTALTIICSGLALIALAIIARKVFNL